MAIGSVRMKDMASADKKCPLAYVLVLNYNGMSHLDECLHSLLAMDYPDFKVVVVDNASTDGSQDYVRSRFPAVEIVQNKRNMQFAGGMNAGMRHALGRGAQYIALVNNDVAAERSWLSEMAAAMESSPRIGGVASRLMYYQNRKILNGVGVGFTRLAYAFDRGQGEIVKERYLRREEVLAFTGGGCLLRSEALRDVGLFDTSLVAYFEDVDLSFRLGAAGWRILAAPAAVLYHKHSASWGRNSPRQKYMILRNRMLLMMKYFPVGELCARVLREFAYEQMQLFRGRLRRRDWRLLALQVLAPLFVLRFAPRALLFRLKNRKKFGYRLYERLEPVYHPASLPYPEWDYGRQTSGGDLPERILFGVNDDLLGDGWFPLECESYPQYRWMCNEADCLLRAVKGRRSVLQVHVRQPLWAEGDRILSVRLNGDCIGKVEVSCGEWHTFHLPCMPLAGEARVLFAADSYAPADPARGRYDLGLQFNEVGLLPEGSPLLRSIQGERGPSLRIRKEK